MTDHPLWLQWHQAFNFKHPIHRVAAASPLLSHLHTSLVALLAVAESERTQDEHMFNGSMEPCSIVAGNLLTSPNPLSPFSHVHINTNGQKGWWDLCACTNTILGVLFMLEHRCPGTDTHTGIFFIIHEEERREWQRESGRITDHKYASFSSFRPNKHLIK